MTSLTGSAGEDFASILRALGYRMDRRPPLPVPAAAPEPVVEQQAVTPEAEPPSAGIVAANDNMVGATHTHDATETAPAVADVVSSAAEGVVPAEVPNVAEQPEPSAVESDAAGAAEPAAAAVAQGEAEAAVDTVALAAADGAVDDSDVPATETVAATPELIEVWRPAGRHEDRKPRHERPRHRRHDQAQPAEAGAQASDGEQGRKEHPRRDRGHRRRRHEGGNAEPGANAQTAAAAGGEASAPVADGGNARPREERRRFQGKGKGRPDDGQANRREQRHGGGQRNERPPAQRPPPRERPIDPNSPFAKLAALKEQLESSAKEKL